MKANLTAAALLAVCACTQRPSALPSSAGQPAYALHYASELTQATKAIDEDEARQKTLGTDLDARIEELKKPKWAHVRAIVDDSDAVGRAADFAESREGSEAVRSFWSDEKEAIANRVAGSAQAIVQKAHCSGSGAATGHGGDGSLDVRGPISYSLSESVDKQVQKRLRSHNDAFVLIERYRTEFGPQNVTALEKLADELAEASYVVHTELPAARDRLRRLVADKQAVSDTLVRYATEEKASEGEPGRTDADIKASEERIAIANRSQTEVEGVAGQASASSKALDDRIARATADYDDVLKAIRTKIDEKRKASGQ
jgi:hypothetical protein